MENLCQEVFAVAVQTCNLMVKGESALCKRRTKKFLRHSSTMQFLQYKRHSKALKMQTKKTPFCELVLPLMPLNTELNLAVIRNRFENGFPCLREILLDCSLSACFAK